MNQYQSGELAANENGFYFKGHHWRFMETKCANCGAEWPFNTYLTKRIKAPCPKEDRV